MQALTVCELLIMINKKLETCWCILLGILGGNSLKDYIFAQFATNRKYKIDN